MPLESMKGRTGPRGKANRSELLKRFNISNILVSEYFSHSSPNSFNGANRKDQVLIGTHRIVEKVLNEIRKNPNLLENVKSTEDINPILDFKLTEEELSYLID